MALAAESSMEERMTELEALEERRNTAGKMQKKYWEPVGKYYNKSVVARAFQTGDLVWKATSAVMQNIETHKFTAKWEGPYEVIKASDTGYYLLMCVNDEFKIGAVNSKYVKKFYP